jgi:nicotinamidase-related amidase
MTNQLPVPPALILVDIQKAFDQPGYYGGERNNPDAEENASTLLEYWRKHQWPLFHIKHCSVHPGSPLAEGHPGNDHKDEVKPLPGEPLIKKSANSAFIGTDLKERLDTLGIRTVVVIGLTTQHCVSTTARMAGNYGYDTFVISDATAAFQTKGLNGENYPAEMVHQLSLATIHQEFATVLTTKAILETMQDRILQNH